MEKVRLGIIGTGGISNEHLKWYKQNPNVELVAFCDIDEERVHYMADRWGVPRERTYTDKDKMLAENKLDAVDVCTWNSAHAECAIAALNAGCHVLCEKPMAMNAREAQAMKDAADKNGKLLQIGFVRRYGWDADIVKEYIENGSLGEIYYAKATYLRRNGNPGGWFGDITRSGGGPLIDLGVHVIDLVRYLIGNPKPVSAFGATFQKLFDRPELRAPKDNMGYAGVAAPEVKSDVTVEDLAAAMIRFDNGAVLSIEASFSLNIKSPRGDLELYGTKGGCGFSPNFEIYTNYGNHMVNIGFAENLAHGDMFQDEMNHFIDCVRNGTPCRAPAEDGVQLMKILDAVYESARTGKSVDIR